MSPVRRLRPAALAAAGLLAAGTASAEPLRVMPLGDSLTKGVGSTHGAGYRQAFLRRMHEAGVEVDMVGSFHSGPKDMDRDHQGHQGQGVAKLDEVTFDELRAERPDVVILMIGTNDAKESQLVPDAFRIRYSVLLDRSLAESRTRLLAATIPPHRFGRGAKVREAINRIIRQEVDKRAAQGKAVRLVDVYTLLDDRADFVDGLHMNDAGYDKVGNAFADALLEMLGSGVQPAAPAAASASP
jgi:lysophospholipase L1-like esterase